MTRSMLMRILADASGPFFDFLMGKGRRSAKKQQASSPNEPACEVEEVLNSRRTGSAAVNAPE